MSYETFLKSQLFKNKSPNLYRLGFDFSNKDIKQEFNKIQSILYSEYHIKCESMLTIMKKFNIPSSKTMDILFRIFDIESRSLSESQTFAIINNRSNNIPNGEKFTAKQGWHITWDNHKVYLRSSYELEFAKMLDEQKIHYEVECLRIKYFDTQKSGYRIAVPDFYIPSTNTIIEVKSHYWYDEINISDRYKEFKALGFNFELFLDKKLVRPREIESPSEKLKVSCVTVTPQAD